MLLGKIVPNSQLLVFIARRKQTKKTTDMMLGTSTVCQHCFGNNRGIEAGTTIQS